MISISADKGKSGAGKNSRDSTRRRRLIVSVIIGSVVVHLIGLAVFGIWVVAQYFQDPPAEFIVQKKSLKIPPETPEHKMNMAKHEAMTPKPTFSDKVISTRPMKFSLPDLPKVPVEQMLPLDPSDLISDQVNSLVGKSGMGNGLGSGKSGGGGTGSGLSFFGIKDNAKSVVIMIDVSASMFGRTGDLDYGTGKLLRQGKDQSFQQVREEAFKLIDSLGVDSRFGIIRWSGGARSWQPELVRATDENKAAAKAHIQNDVDANSSGPLGGRPGGTRHDYALEELLKLNPEVAFMLSDGNATRSKPGGGSENIPEDELVDIIQEAAKSLPSIPRIHTLYYLTGADKSEEEKLLKNISRKSKGKFKKIKLKK
jgi:hypothetical protein